MINNSRGSTLVTVVIFVAILSILSATLLLFVSSQVRKQNSQENIFKSYYIAESGITKAIAYIYENRTYIDFDNNGNGNGNGNDNGDNNGNGNDNEEPQERTIVRFETRDNKRIKILEDKTVYVDINSNVNGTFNSTKIHEVKDLKIKTTEYKNAKILEIESSINEYISKSINIQNNLDRIENEINSINSNPVIIKTSSLDINRNTTLGSLTKSVVLIVDNLNMSNSQLVNLEVYGSLIVMNSINANTKINIKTHKIEDEYGDFWIKGNINTNSTDSIIETENSIYFSMLNANQSINIKADSILMKNLNTSGSLTAIQSKKDILLENIQANRDLNIVSLEGDLIIENNLMKNGILNVDIRGRFTVGGNITCNNNNTNIHTGGISTSVILDTDKDKNQYENKYGKGNGYSNGKFKSKPKDNTPPTPQDYILIKNQEEVPFPREYSREHKVTWRIEQIADTNYYGITSTSLYGKTVTELECLVEYNPDNTLSILYLREK